MTITPERRQALWGRIAPEVPRIARGRRRRRVAVLCAAGALPVLVAAVALQLARPRDETVVDITGDATRVAPDRVVLREGRVGVEAHGPFAVETPEARVDVLGTRFSVESRGGHTTVAVDEGAVRVRPRAGGRERVVRALESVTVPEPQPLPEPAPLEPAPPEPPARDPTAPEKSTSAAATVPAPAVVPLATKAVPPDAMAEADAARARGDLARAIDLYLAVAREARGVRSENAFAAAARACEQAGRPGDAADVWRDYLRAHPRGLHREQASRALGRLDR